MKVKLLCSALLIGLMVGPAMASVVVNLVPQDTIVAIGSGPFMVDIVADIPEAEAIAGWGMDLSVLDTLVADKTGTVAIGADWTAAPSMDGDGLAGLAFTTPVFGNGIVLASVQFMPVGLGTTGLAMGDDQATDVTEGFALFPSGFASVQYGTGSITVVVPEPATLTLLALGGLALIRRR